MRLNPFQLSSQEKKQKHACLILQKAPAVLFAHNNSMSKTISRHDSNINHYQHLYWKLFFLQRLLITISLTSCFSNSHLKFVNVSRFSVWVSKLSYKSNSSNVVKRSKFSIFFRRFCRRHKVYGKKKFADTKDWKDIMVTSNFELPSDNITDTSLITIFGP